MKKLLLIISLLIPGAVLAAGGSNVPLGQG